MDKNQNPASAGTLGGAGIFNQADAGSKTALIAASPSGNLAVPLEGLLVVDPYRPPVVYDMGNDVTFAQTVARLELGRPYIRIIRFSPPRFVYPTPYFGLQFVDVRRNTRDVLEYYGSRQAAEVAAIWAGGFVGCAVFGRNSSRRPRKKKKFKHRNYLKRQRLVAERRSRLAALLAEWAVAI